MWALLVFVLVSTAIASPATRIQEDADAPDSKKILPRMIKDRCDRNGDASTFKNFIEARKRHEDNLKIGILRYNIDKMLKDDYNIDERLDNVKMICSLNATYKTGFVNMAATVRPCVRDEYRQILDRVPEVVDSSFKQMCSNGIHSFYPHPNEDECILRHRSKIVECFEHFVGDILKPFEPMTKEREVQKTLDGDQPLLDVKTCVKNELDQCPNSSTLFTNLPQTVIDAIGMHRLL